MKITKASKMVIIIYKSKKIKIKHLESSDTGLLPRNVYFEFIQNGNNTKKKNFNPPIAKIIIQ